MKAPFVIWDLDGTLVDSSADIVAAANAARADFGRPPLRSEQVRSYVGEGAARLMDQVMGESEPAELRRAAVDRFLTRYAENLRVHTVPFPGIESIVQRLSGQQAIATNKAGTLARSLVELMGWTSLFRVVLGAGDVTNRKPSPDIVFRILELAGVRLEDALFVGDTPIDIRTAAAAKMRMVCVTWGSRPGDELSDAPTLVDTAAELEREIRPVKPWQTLDTAATPDGKSLVLTMRDGDYLIHVNGNVLMSSRLHHSEEAMAEPLKELDRRGTCRVLIGGLGMGFTLRAALDVLPSRAEVVVAELFSAVVRWNEGPLAPLACHPLSDPRTKVVERDVIDVLETSPGAFDAILLDVDNGPSAFTTASNARLYGPAGGGLLRGALNADGPGLVVIWSAGGSAAPVLRGFKQQQFVRGRPNRRGPRHVLYVARRS